jgi:signal transduction histidine kinase
MVRSQLLRRPLRGFVAPASRPSINAYLEDLFAQPGKKACEAQLQTAAGATFWADLQASAATWIVGDREWCRVAISDIAALKRGEAAQRRVESLSVSMQSANREIVRRREVEASLKESERRQRELLAESQELHEQLRRLTHQILLAQEEERKKISRQLHDEIAQVLAGISVQLTTLKSTKGIDARTLRQQIGKTRSLVAESIRVVHDFARDLRPAMLDDLGLVPALNSFVKELARGNKLQIGFTASPEVEVLDSTRRTVLYRVAQEALTNVIRHARARHATVKLTKCAATVRLAIHDDGRSFPAARLLEAKQGGRLGLLGMRERVEMVGGHFSITSTPGEGTTVTAEIPLGAAEPVAPQPPLHLPT